MQWQIRHDLLDCAVHCGLDDILQKKMMMMMKRKKGKIGLKKERSGLKTVDVCLFAVFIPGAVYVFPSTPGRHRLAGVGAQV